MIFKQLFATIWRFFDIICFILALFVADYGAFLFGKPWGILALAITLFLIGWMTEVITAHKKGGD